MARAADLFYEKVSWIIEGVEKGLRYGENPGQEAALYRLVNGNLALGNAKTIVPGKHLVSDIELLQSGKHPGKTNLTDADNSLNILRYFTDTPCAVIVKHNNPCGAARADSLEQAYAKAIWPTVSQPLAAVSRLTRPWTRQPPKALPISMLKWSWLRSLEDGVIEILGRRKICV